MCLGKWRRRSDGVADVRGSCSCCVCPSMAASHNAVLLVDAADLALRDRTKLLSLRLLNFLTCRAGPGQVRWSYRFLNSLGGRCRHPRRSDLRELGPRSWDDFEEELEACLERSRSGRCSGLPSSRAALTHAALMETLSDFQWDRPDITSPAKPAAGRGRRGSRLIAVDEPMQADSPSEAPAACGPRNAVFLLSPCPHSRAQLGEFAAAGADIGLQQLMEKLLPRRLQSIVSNKRVTVYWLDTADWSQVWDSCDHFGYWTMVEVMQRVGGRVLPSESLLADGPFSSGAALKIPFDSVLSSLISNEQEHRLQFPQQDGIVYFMTPGESEQWDCAVTLEPISITQKHITGLRKIHIKGTMQNWNMKQIDPLTMETWVLQSSSNDRHAPSLHFQQLLHTVLSKRLLLVADVLTEPDLLPRTGILSPISETAAVLNLVVSNLSIGIVRLLLQETVEETNEAVSSGLQDIVSGVLSHDRSCEESTTSPDVLMPEWIKQELSQSNPWTSSVIEKWYPLSGTSGASSNLMESFRLISAASFDQDEQKHDQEITHYLSDLYQKKPTDEPGGVVQGENQKKRLPRTPMRQKMKTMPRALQMLNVARLNLKAQKSQPEGVVAAPADKNSQAKRRTSDKPEVKAKKQMGFKSEEELISFLVEDYNRAVSGEENSLLSCVRNVLTTIKSYLKSVSSEEVEAGCMGKIRCLLKTSKVIRQLYGQNPNKVAKLRECQLQALIRLEMCMQCKSIQSNEDEMEQVVEEITDMLRIISLTEDPTFLTAFLAEVLVEYIGSIPRILADIYFSLGTQIPKELALVLPTDGDDCLTHEGKTPMYSQPSISRVPSLPQIGNEEDQLEELRTRSAKKRRTSTMARQRSIAEASQTMRQIEVPKKLIRESSNSNLVVMVEKLKLPLQAQPPKDAEATKVRRNLFVQENRSPTRRGTKMPRSQSVSTVEELKHKRSKTHDGTRDHYKLLTKKVTETPAHKQLANRLLHKQIKGRHTESTSNISIVEESPEKDIRELDLRRSPRIKQLSLTRKNSSFYASQPKSRNLDRVHSSSQLLPCGDPKGGALTTEAKTPKRLLFGEVLQLNSPTTRRARRRLLNDTEPVTDQLTSRSQRKTPRKTPQKANRSCEGLFEKNRSPGKSPCTPRPSGHTPKTLKTPSKSPLDRKSAADNLGKYFSPSKVEGRSPIKSCERRSERLAQITPSKSDCPARCFISPLKTPKQIITPQKERLKNHEFISPEKTPKSVSLSNSAAKPTQLSCTPRKSPSLQSPKRECVTPTRYHLRTPQKSTFQAPTPEKSVARKLSVLSSATERTPQKETLCSPTKHVDEVCSMLPNTSPPYNASILGLSSMPLCLQTPQKSQLKECKPGCSPAITDEPKLPPFSKDTSQLTEVSGVGKYLSVGFTPALPQNVHVSEEVLTVKSPSASKVLSPKCKGDLIVLCERLDVSSLESSQDSECFANNSQTDESIDISEAKVVSTETSDLKMKILIKRKSSDTGLMSRLQSTPGDAGNVQCTSPYGLRFTVDRRQREAAARLGTPQIPAKFSTPKSQKKMSSPAFYEVQLEMQDSGLPKLRFKRTDSNHSVMGSQTRIEESPSLSRNRKGDESPFRETWCNKHGMKLESPCLRSSHNTPGKTQTFICQSYTPSRCSSNTASPMQADAASPWTPSPKYKDKNGSDLINNWPRRKKASAVKATNVLKGERKQDDTSSAPSTDEGSLEQEVNKTSPLLDLMVDEGVSKLLELSPVLELEGKREIGTMAYKCRKRCFDLLSPTKETQSSSKRSCTLSSAYDVKEFVVSTSQSLSSNLDSSQQSSCEDEVFNISGFTPPNKLLKNSLSASGLLSLTQSPMLFKGKTPSSKRKLQDGEPQHDAPEMKRPALHPANLDDSPFSNAAPRRTISRTYTRKKLIT
ncbi:treslin isoform X2 [Pseudophryne corroboree]|uniref:treslin isoform X2 n=1 Tax=Pseudophryne corroboree TaxID=495146 RepID=UPI0030812403